MACLNHFSTEPLSACLFALLQAQENTIAAEEELPADLIEHLPIASKKLKSNGAILKALSTSVARSMVWKLGLTWINLIATALQKLTRSSGCMLHSLYSKSISEGQHALSLVNKSTQSSFSVAHLFAKGKTTTGTE